MCFDNLSAILGNFRKRLLVYSLLCVALATGNALFWLHKWHEQGVELCFADTMMTGVQPSFLLMLLIPPTLGLVHQLKFILEQPFVICALDNRTRLARNLLAALLFIAFRAVMAVSIPSIHWVLCCFEVANLVHGKAEQATMPI